MSTKTRNRNRPTVPELLPIAQSTNTPTTGRTEAEAKLWKALGASPNSAAGELASAASIGKSTAGKILARWANEGRVVRTAGIIEGGRRSPDRWAIAGHKERGTTEVSAARTDAGTSADNEATATSPTVTDAAHGKPTNTPTASTDTSGLESVAGTPVTDNAVEQPAKGDREKAPRLAPGALRGMVEDYLRDHSTEAFGPAAIGRVLGRSSGAVANALDRLTEHGVVVQTSQAPRRYRIAAHD